MAPPTLPDAKTPAEVRAGLARHLNSDMAAVHPNTRNIIRYTYRLNRRSYDRARARYVASTALSVTRIELDEQLIDRMAGRAS